MLYGGRKPKQVAEVSTGSSITAGLQLFSAFKTFYRGITETLFVMLQSDMKQLRCQLSFSTYKL